MKHATRNPPHTPITRTRIDETAEQTEEQIRQRAYELYEARGKGDGCDLDDWLLAEGEVTERTKATAA